MRSGYRCKSAICSVFLLIASANSLAQPPAAPRELESIRLDGEQLAERFQDDLVSFQPPIGLTFFGQMAPAEYARRGARSYGWKPAGEAGSNSPKSISVNLTPFAQPSADALDKVVGAMQESMQGDERVVQPKFGKTQAVRLNGFEARTGSFTATLLGQKVLGYYLIGIDKTGTFGVTAMLPESEATPAAKRAFQASVVSFRRPAPKAGGG
jgi:hypothetical protein